MGINLMKDLGFDDEIAVRNAREAAVVRAHLIDALVDSREMAGLSQDQLAKRMGTTQSAVSDIENGSDARLSTLIRYAQAAGCEVRVSVIPPVVAAPVESPDWITVEIDTRRAPSSRAAWVALKSAHVEQVRVDADALLGSSH